MIDRPNGSSRRRQVLPILPPAPLSAAPPTLPSSSAAAARESPAPRPGARRTPPGSGSHAAGRVGESPPAQNGTSTRDDARGSYSGDGRGSSNDGGDRSSRTCQASFRPPTRWMGSPSRAPLRRTIVSRECVEWATRLSCVQPQRRLRYPAGQRRMIPRLPAFDMGFYHPVFAFTLDGDSRRQASARSPRQSAWGGPSAPGRSGCECQHPA